MANLQFLAGAGFTNKAPGFKAGSVYFDSLTGEVWFDDPREVISDHIKVIDLDTLIYDYNTNDSVAVDFLEESANSKSAARLGMCVLGTMMTGKD